MTKSGRSILKEWQKPMPRIRKWTKKYLLPKRGHTVKDLIKNLKKEKIDTQYVCDVHVCLLHKLFNVDLKFIQCISLYFIYLVILPYLNYFTHY